MPIRKGPTAVTPPVFRTRFVTLITEPATPVAGAVTADTVRFGGACGRVAGGPR